MPTPTVYTPLRLIISQQLTTSSNTLYTVPAVTTAQLTGIYCINTGTFHATVTIHLLESAAIADNAHLFANAVTIPPDGMPFSIVGGDWPAQPQSIYMNAADFLQAKASNNNQITIHISGVELA